MMGSMSSVDVDEFPGASNGAGDGDLAGVERLEAIRLRLVADIEAEPPADRARNAASRAATALAAVSEVDPSQLDAADLRAWLEDVEALRRTVDAAAVTAGWGDRPIEPVPNPGVLLGQDRRETHVPPVGPRSTPTGPDRPPPPPPARLGRR